MKSKKITPEEVLQKRKALGERLKELRELHSLTMDELGELIDVGKSTISKIEAGKWNVGVDTLLILEEELNFKIHLL